MNKSKLRRENKELQKVIKQLEEYERYKRIFTPNPITKAIRASL